MHAPFDYDALDAGIRAAVRLIHGVGLPTADSGDGTLTGDKADMDCALDFAHVVIPSDRGAVLDTADRVAALDWAAAGYDPPTVEARYTGGGGSAEVIVHWPPAGEV